MLTGSATVFFAYIGFDSVASTAEEVIACFSLGFAFSPFFPSRILLLNKHSLMSDGYYIALKETKNKKEKNVIKMCFLETEA